MPTTSRISKCIITGPGDTIHMASSASRFCHLLSAQAGTHPGACAWLPAPHRDPQADACLHLRTLQMTVLYAQAWTGLDMAISMSSIQ